MAELEILRLDAYRERREQRLRLAASLYGADAARSELLQHLARVASLIGADRAATVWVDEYGPGLVHPHVVLDLLSDRPRRAFAAEPLRRAWEGGVPGLFEGSGGAPGRGDGPAWTLAVALGSDGTRSWFLVADAVSPGRGLTDALRDRIMFLAGECSSVVLHRDLDAMAQAEAEGPRPARPRFAGWPILQDIEGREEDEGESRRIALRFLVARLPRLLVDDDLAIPLDRLRQQAERAREELDRDGEGLDPGPEADLWNEVLDAFQAGELERLGRALVALGTAVENDLHYHGAAELYRTAYELFAATGCPSAAVDAARFTGRAFRRMGRFDEANRWYGIAKGVAVAGALDSKVAQVAMGFAVLLTDKGNLPAARGTLLEALPHAERSGVGDARGGVYNALAAAEHLMGNLDAAVEWGWRAVEAYDTPEDRMVALASLGGVLIDTGDLDAATNAWTCARYLSGNGFYRLYAVDALGHIAALRGDRASFALLSAEADAMGWESGVPYAKAEILHYRGLSFRALGETAKARAFLERAVAFAHEHGYGRTLIKAEQDLAALDQAADGRSSDGAPAPPAPAEVRHGLEELRVTLEGAAV